MQEKIKFLEEEKALEIEIEKQKDLIQADETLIEALDSEINDLRRQVTDREN